MELGLSLGEAAPAKSFSPAWKRGLAGGAELRLGFSVGLERETAAEEEPTADEDSPVQLDLLPFSPLPRLASSQSLVYPWPKPASDRSGWCGGGVDVNAAAAAAISSSPDGGDNERASSRGSDEDENARTRKKLRLSKEQSAFLEESFREHNTLNPKQKIALAKQLNLRPRQVEVWFQNRRARTKLKQTEVDCEYLKSCCERLTEENRRLHKELQELRALKTSHPFYTQFPATTLTMCPSCERVATAATACSSAGRSAAGAPPVVRPVTARSPPSPQQPANQPAASFYCETQ